MDDYLNFLKASPTPWHACVEIKKRLSGYTCLNEGDEWDLKPGQNYLMQRGGTIIAFRMPTGSAEKCLIVGSHTDSPSLRLKPNPSFREKTMNLYRVGIFGGPLLYTWFDRDLSVAGIVMREKEGKIVEELVHDKTPITIPSLAIHLQNEKERKALTVDKQKHINPIFSLSQEEVHPYEDALSFDLFLVPLEEPRVLTSGLIAGYRNDNLSSAYATLAAFAETKNASDTLHIAAFFNHEEIGSGTDEGAKSPLVTDIIERIGGKRLRSKSLCLSLDVTHAFHPHFPDKHDPQHQSLLGNGFVIKYNSNMMAMSSARTAAPIVQMCRKHGIPYQENADNNSLRTGSTIGPHIASSGIATADLGVPLLGMHSIRELIHGDDLQNLIKLVTKMLE